MFGSIGMPELIIILVIALIFFGPGKLPELGSTIGKAIRGFKKAINEPEKKPLEPEGGASTTGQEERMKEDGKKPPAP
jgi:sec-independent protein translocase protein TatA